MYEKMMVTLYKDNRAAINALGESTLKAVRNLSKSCKVAGIGLILSGLDFMILFKLVDEQNKRITELETKVKELEDAATIYAKMEDSEDE